MLPESIAKYFVKADETRQDGPCSAHNYDRWRGTSGYNGGILAVVDPDGGIWVTRTQIFETYNMSDPEGIPISVVPEFQLRYQNGGFLKAALQAAGYEHKGSSGMLVPHCRVDQPWVAEQLASRGMTRRELIKEILDEQDRIAVAARLERINAIAAANQSVVVQ